MGIQRNTNLLNLIRSLGEEQLDLNRKLDGTNKAIFVDEDNEEKRKIQQKKELFKAQLEGQAKEIDILKTEINLQTQGRPHLHEGHHQPQGCPPQRQLRQVGSSTAGRLCES